MEGAPTTAPEPPGVAEVRRIVSIREPAVRNLEITYCYSRLSAAVAVRTGQGANWCTYATWASRQAGRTIRGEDLGEHLARAVATPRDLVHPAQSAWRALLRKGLLEPDTRLGRAVAELHTPFDAFERASDAVARGNRKVFEEIGLEFARYLAECPPDAPPGSGEFERFLGGLRDGEPPGGQGYLRRAFARYDRLRAERDSRTRVELAVLANLEIGLHEQTRLQPEIREALDAPFATTEELGACLLHALHPPAADWWAAARATAAGALGLAGPRAQRATSEIAREAITHCLMTLSLPGRVLALGRDLADAFPEGLREPRDAELLELLSRFEPAPPAVDDCAVRDWADLRERMHYIAHLFRVFHEAQDLFRPPFTPEQVRALGAGRIPAGDL
ncbi:MAG TPA: hypothetical protein VFR63_11210 [Gaiellaceae bacterium]|nr:hypothetical protein [Gaiellaceae bacterium]